MNGRFLLDTNIVIALFATDSDVIDFLSQAQDVFIPSIVLGELYYGAYKSKRAKTNLKQISEFADSSAILDCDRMTSGLYGMIKNELKSQGRPIPENDIWIAAMCIQHRLILVSRDLHFHEIDGLQVESCHEKH